MVTAAALKVWFVMRASRFRLGQARPRDRARVTVVGTAPIRVLVTGAGLAAGYGVETWSRSFAGPLAERLAEGTRRGVTVDIAAAPLLPARDVVHHIGANGAHTYRLAVFAPCFLEAAVTPESGITRHAARIQGHLLDTGGDGLRLAVIGIPRPARFSRLDLAAARTADAANRALRSAAAADGRATYLDPPAFDSVHDDRPFTERYYAELGRSIADRLLPALGYAVP